LQGGGSHGAYAWGVIEQLIDDGRIDIDSLSGTSAGAMNAVVYAYGRMKNGPQGAKEALHNFWYEVSKIGNGFKLVYHNHVQKFMNHWNADRNPSFLWFQMITRLFSPYEWNPLNINPLKDVLEKCVNFEELKLCECANIFIGTTCVRTGKVQVFHNKSITADVVMASSCLPTLFQSVKIGNDCFWDGGFSGNPPLFPLISRSKSRDVIIVHINPMVREEIPDRPLEIMNRMNEIAFNSSLLKELRAISFVIKLLDEEWLKEEYRGKLRHLLIHSIHADQPLKGLGVSSKFSTDWGFLTYLRDLGRAEAKRWLKENYDKVGVEATVNLRSEYIDTTSTKM
jgi:NTE family protein